MKTSTPTGSIVAFTLALLVAQSAYAFYNPQLGRWATRDPIEEEGGFNLYAVAFNDLVNSRDAFGLQGKGGKPATPPPQLNPDDWKAGRENCCAYAYDLPGKQIQPGSMGGVQPEYPHPYTCADLMKRIIADFNKDPNVINLPGAGKCPEGYHKIKPWVGEENSSGFNDYHFYRQDGDDTWSQMDYGQPPTACKNPKKPHKPGDTPCKDMCVPNRPRP